MASHFNIDIGHPKFKKENLMIISNHLNETKEKSTTYNSIIESISKSKNSLLNFIKGKKIYYLLLFFPLLLVVQKRWNKLFYILLSALVTLSLIFYLDFFIGANHFKERVLFGIALPLSLIIISYIDFSSFLKNRLFKKIYFVVFSLGILFFITSFIKQTISRIELQNEKQLVTEKIYETIDYQNDIIYVDWLNLDFEYYDIFKLPIQSKSYSLGWMSGSPFNRDKIEKITGNRNDGIYSIYNKDVAWYYRNDGFVKYQKMDQKVKDFYFSNFDSVEFKEFEFPISKKDTIYKYVFNVCN